MSDNEKADDELEAEYLRGNGPNDRDVFRIIVLRRLSRLDKRVSKLEMKLLSATAFVSGVICLVKFFHG